MPDYCAWTDVVGDTGRTGIPSNAFGDDTQTIIEEFIEDAEKRINDKLGIPYQVYRELHLGDGEKYEFKLGPEDEQTGEYDPENCVTDIHAVWLNRQSSLRPDPKDGDLTESIASTVGTSNCTASDDTSILKAGSNSLKLVFSQANGYGEYPTTNDWRKNIDQYRYIGFLARLNDATATITVTLYNSSTKYATKTFTLGKDDIWQFIALRIDEFTLTGSVNWEDDLLNYIRFTSDQAVTLYLDNYAHCDEYLPQMANGYLYYCHDTGEDESPMSAGERLIVNYEWNPFTVTIPQQIAEATKYYASAKAWERLSGVIAYATRSNPIRMRTMTDTGGQRDAAYGLMGQALQCYKRFDEILDSFGLGGTGGVF